MYALAKFKQIIIDETGFISVKRSRLDTYFPFQTKLSR